MFASLHLLSSCIMLAPSLEPGVIIHHPCPESCGSAKGRFPPFPRDSPAAITVRALISPPYFIIFVAWETFVPGSYLLQGLALALIRRIFTGFRVSASPHA